MKSNFLLNPTRFIPISLYLVLIYFILQGTLESVHGQWTKHIIDSSIEYHYVTRGYDIENDGDMDLFVAEYGAGNILFYENNNNLNWTKHLIDSKVGRVIGLDLADFDKDGHFDVVADHSGAHLVAWYRNIGTDPIRWIKDTIDSSIFGPSGVKVADINGDGATDVVTKAYTSGEMIWYQNNLPLTWTKHIFGLNVPESGYYEAADIDDDGKPDVIRSVTLQNKVILYKNNLPDQAWTEVLIDGNLLSTRHAHAADIDNDGDLDIVTGAQEGFYGGQDIVWYESDGSGEKWIRHIIESDLNGARGIAIADFDTNGYLDFVATDPGAQDVILFLNVDGGKNWIKRTIDNNFTNANSVWAYDIDMDGD